MQPIISFHNVNNAKGLIECTNGSKYLAADFFDTGIRKLLPRYQKCVEVRGDYVEK